MTGLSPSVAGHAFPCMSHLTMEIPYLVGFARNGRALSVVKSDWRPLKAVAGSRLQEALDQDGNGRRKREEMWGGKRELVQSEENSGTPKWSARLFCFSFVLRGWMLGWSHSIGCVGLSAIRYALLLFPMPAFFTFIAMCTWKAVNEFKNYLLLCVRGSLECEQYFLSP